MWADEPREEPMIPVAHEAPGGAYVMLAYMVPWGIDPRYKLPLVAVVSLN